MGLDGGGGGGGILGVTGTFTGPAESLDIYGDFAAAYSGVISDPASGAADTVMLKFTSGNYVFLGHLNFTDNAIANDNMYLTVTLNGASVIDLVYKSGAVGSDNLNPYNILIPGYTEVEVKFGSSGNVNGTTWLIGRIYRD